jgi:tight adherence protein B
VRSAAAFCIAVTCALGVGLIAGVVPRTARRRARRSAALGRSRLWLRQAGLPLSPVQFVAGSALAGGCVFVGLALLTGTPLVAFAPAIGLSLVPFGYFGRRRAARLRSVQESWPDGLRDVVASLAAGSSLAHALSTLAVSGPEPLQHAFARFPLVARTIGVSAALDVLREELADPTSDRVLEVLILANERGGAIVRDVLEDLIVTTTRDLKLAEELETDALETRINTRAVLVLPWLVLVALTIRPGAFRDFYQSTPGVLVVAGGGVLSAVGALWVRQLTRADAEPRVLGASAAGTDEP